MDRARRARTSSPTKRPDYRPAGGRRRRRTRIAGTDPFIMQADGKAWLYAPAGLADGPLPAHYEPQESPVRQPALRPAAQPGPRDQLARDNRYNPSGASPAARSSRTCSPPTGSPSTTPPAG